MSPGHSGKVRFALHLALPMSYRVTDCMLRKKDVSPSSRSIMKKQAHDTPDTPIKASAQAAGFLREHRHRREVRREDGQRRVRGRVVSD